MFFKINHPNNLTNDISYIIFDQPFNHKVLSGIYFFTIYFD